MTRASSKGQHGCLFLPSCEPLDAYEMQNSTFFHTLPVLLSRIRDHRILKSAETLNSRILGLESLRIFVNTILWRCRP